MNLFDFISKYVYPSIKRCFFITLNKKHGLSVKRIADKLHVSRNMVTRYINGSSGNVIKIDFNEKICLEVSEFAEKMIRENLDPFIVRQGLIKIMFKWLYEGYFCKHHIEIDSEKEFLKNCKLCMLLFRNYRN